MTHDKLIAGLRDLTNQWSDRVAQWEAAEAYRQKTALPELGKPHDACAKVLSQCVAEIYALLDGCQGVSEPLLEEVDNDSDDE